MKITLCKATMSTAPTSLSKPPTLNARTLSLLQAPIVPLLLKLAWSNVLAHPGLRHPTGRRGWYGLNLTATSDGIFPALAATMVLYGAIIATGAHAAAWFKD